ncbi:MAG: hypothetical protein ACRC5C_00025 [Bacilli bacterium]
MYDLYYSFDGPTLFQVSPNGTQKVVDQTFPTAPVFSPDRKEAIYLSPVSWDAYTTLYHFVASDGHVVPLIEPKDDGRVPKFAIWLNEESIAVIIGQKDPNRQVGGDVFGYSLKTKQYWCIRKAMHGREFTSLEVAEDTLKMRGLAFENSSLVAFEECISLYDIESEHRPIIG